MFRKNQSEIWSRQDHVLWCLDQCLYWESMLRNTKKTENPEQSQLDFMASQVSICKNNLVHAEKKLAEAIAS